MIAPRATYRLQLHARFRFADAEAAVPYLAELGISHLYLSPILQAAEGSTHGYDTVDPDRVSAELGGEDGFRSLVAAARAAGLGILLDIVPNHMSIAGRGNRWWLDVLENGPSSRFAHFFDVDWSTTLAGQSPARSTSGSDDRVLLPILTERYGRALTSGALAIVHDGKGKFRVKAGDVELPIAPRSLGMLVRRAGERIRHDELGFLGDALSALPSPLRREIDARRRRHRDKAVLAVRLAALCTEEACARAIADELAAVNADPAELDAILEAQNYRLSHWSVASDHVTYRRFFDINSLVAIRNEDPDVFEASHARILGWLADRTIDGVRIDHVDGLRDPEGYLQRLRERAPDAWIVVEKIVTADEHVPPTWPIEGTTGYELGEKLGGLFVDPAGETKLTRAFEALTEQPWDPGGASRRARIEVMSDALHSELARLTELAVRACHASPACRDYTRVEIENAIREILAGYPVYRTYLREDARGAGGIDRDRIAAAVTAASDARPDIDRDLLSYLEAALAFELTSEATIELAYATQQVTGAITAKGDEDTVLYRQVRLVARNDVGAELRRFAHPPVAVHGALARDQPRRLLTTSTHDTKRSEDVRARIAVISEIPDAWSEAVLRWRVRADRYWVGSPDRVLEYAMWQNLVGAWPLPLDRAKAYARKASREARLRTSWRHPDEAYEAAIDRWCDGVYGDRDLVGDVARFAAELTPHGDRNALAQLLVKLTAPGVPDFYQGTELRDDSLVDPDNRRAIDLEQRRERLRWSADATARTVIETTDLGSAKIWTIRRVLGLRRKLPARFEGTYRALDASGPHAHRVFAFSRGDDLITIVPRLGVNAEGWRDTTISLPPGSWRDVLGDRSTSGGVQPLAELWRPFPTALLSRA
ncbi:MAG: 1,4-alpha-D-glucan 1-alpha-D-glucosylmutase [Myxococcales bacterium]|nr:1,4-alpha-D-glucan 1-alpha-D-glucosylmutase [Myxococcales bacterium]